MILIDTSVLIYKNLFSAVKNSTDEFNRPIKKVNGVYKTKDFIQLFKAKMFNDLRYIYKSYRTKYNEMVLCIDDHSASNWKKSFFPEYKMNRKKARKESDVNFTEFFIELEEILDFIKDAFPFKVISVPKVEADEIIAVLTESFYPKEDILIVSTDKDFNQLFKYKNVKIYDPLKLKMKKVLSTEELMKWRIEHIMLGDVSDNVPKVVARTEFSNDFVQFLETNNIYVKDVLEFEALSISNKLYEEFIKEYPNKDIFKVTRFGPVALKKFMENFNENMDSNKLYWYNYKRNEKLVLFEYIPDEQRSDILEAYNNAEVNFSIPKIMNYFMTNNLMDLYQNYQDFIYVHNKSSMLNSSIDSDDSDESLSDVESLVESLDEW